MYLVYLYLLVKIHRRLLNTAALKKYETWSYEKNKIFILWLIFTMPCLQGSTGCSWRAALVAFQREKCLSAINITSVKPLTALNWKLWDLCQCLIQRVTCLQGSKGCGWQTAPAHLSDTSKTQLTSRRRLSEVIDTHTMNEKVTKVMIFMSPGRHPGVTRASPGRHPGVTRCHPRTIWRRNSQKV